MYFEHPSKVTNVTGMHQFTTIYSICAHANHVYAAFYAYLCCIRICSISVSAVFVCADTKKADNLYLSVAVSTRICIWSKVSVL